ncbi:ferrochelatase [Lentisphaera profundi]|uniref:Ferrochelatase n=1 Tax=Lentisphaera profundi TaxID=1658616 RepID=A0ABY7VRN1_9BACT|nr:ferrochelatase [Lentisphaera profundi]WDE95890.1 ferrochelatase [Lentisphaera profundi]
MSKTGVLLIQLGSPASPAVSDVKAYLSEFLGDPRVVDKQNFTWKIILNLFILPSRSPKSAEAYAKIWEGDTFPLFRNTESFTTKLQEQIKDENILVEYSYILSKPNVIEQYGKLIAAKCDTIRVIPLFPQYCEATTLSCKDMIDKAIAQHGKCNKLEFVEDFHNSPPYINNVAKLINEDIRQDKPEKLLFSFHGYPIRRIRGGDPYFAQCTETAHLIASKIEGIAQEDILLSFQSKFGREPWLTPGTEETIIELALSGVKNIAITCPAFVVDNLETLEEVAIGLEEIFLEHGGEKFRLIPCLNDNDQWVEDFAEEIALSIPEDISRLESSPCEFPKAEEQGCCHAATQCDTCPYKGLDTYPDGELSPKNRAVLKTMFLTLFVDLIGFSIIFPLFPGIIAYYNKVEGDGSLFRSLMNQIEAIAGIDNPHATMALFGGALIFIYSFLQFLMAPVFGVLSDRFGRRPILLFSIFGIAFSYLLWFFSGSFLLLLISRLVSGLMGSNITTATAAVADTTSEKTRSRGMAIIGIAFGLGFILGPAIGGISAWAIDLSTVSNWADYGINPFSAPAAIAFVLSIANFIFVYRKFPETLPVEKRGLGEVHRTINPIKLFKVENYPGVSSVIFTNFIFLTAFGAAENMLTFLTLERLGYGPAKNGLLFVFIGFVLSMVQGGYVRRKAASVGEAVVTKKGLAILIPGLILIALAGLWQSAFVLYLGLFFMAVGSAMVIPCLTSLVSLYTPASEQGRVLGVFRSAGALARTLGPILGGILYWKFSYMSPFFAAAAIVIIPLLMVKSLPNKKKS